jgi:transcriptional regulator with XRE-family HTH domain
MKLKTTLSKNLSHLRQLNKMSQQEVADKLQFKHKSKYGAYEDGRAEPSTIVLQELSDLFEVPIDMLIKEDLTHLEWTDYWNMKDSWLRIMPLDQVKKKSRNRVVVAPDSSHARAGLPAGQFSDDFEELVTISLPDDPGSDAIAFPIVGDSMPPIAEGDFVVGKKINSIKEISDGRSYVVRFQEDDGSPFETLYKIVFDRTKEDGTLHLYSTNPDYPVRKLPAEQVRELYRYWCHISYQEPEENKMTIDDLSSMLRSVKKDISKLKK